MSLVPPMGTLKFTKPDAEDIVQYFLYWRDLGVSQDHGPLTHDDAYVHVTPVDLGDGTLEVDLVGLDIVVGHDSIVKFGISAVDDADNVADISNNIDVPFDLEAPAPITDLRYSPRELSSD